MPPPKFKTLKPKIGTLDTSRGAPIIQRITGRKLQQIRERIFLRDEGVCQHCKKFTINFEIDHITPLHLGGAESDENRQLLCIPCQNEKSKQEGRDRSL